MQGFNLIFTCGLTITFSNFSRASDLFSDSKPLPAIFASSYLSAKNLTGDQIKVLGNQRDPQASVELISNSQVLRYQRDGGRASLELQSNVGDKRYVFHFMENILRRKYVLDRVSVTEVKKLFYDNDLGSFESSTSDSNATSESKHSVGTTLQCDSSNSTFSQVKSLFDAIKSSRTCASFNTQISSAASPFYSADFAESDSVKCLSSYPAYVLLAKTLSTNLKSANGTVIACDLTDKSNFDPDSKRILVGKEILAGPLKTRSFVLFHELLHAAGIRGESENVAATNCCAFPKSSDSSCVLISQYDKVYRLDSNSEATVQNLLLDTLNSKQLTSSEKTKVVKQTTAALDDLRGAYCSDNGKNVSAVESSVRNIALSYSPYANLDSRENLQLRLDNDFKNARKYVAETGCSHGNRLGNVDNIQGTALADTSTPSSANGATQTPITPPQLTYSPSTTAVNVAKAQVEKVRAPMMAARAYTSSVARTFLAGMGSTAIAAQTSLPVKISNDEWSTSVQNFDPKSGEVTLNLGVDAEGRTITGSANIPFSGSNFGTPVVKIEHGEHVLASADGSSINLSSIGGQPSTRPGRIGKSAAAVAANDSASGSSTSEAQASGSGSLASTSSSLTSAAAPRGPTSLASTSREPPPSLNASALKRMFARAGNPAVLIKSHIEDLKANSMLIRFGCTWYPLNFKGHELFDLDAYQGRKCAP